MSTKPDELGSKLDELGKQILDGAIAMDPSENLELKMDAFKTVCNYHVAITRARLKQPDEDNEGMDFNGFRNAIKQAEAGSA